MHTHVCTYITKYSAEYGPEFVLHPEPSELVKRNSNSQEDLDAVVESVRGGWVIHDCGWCGVYAFHVKPGVCAFEELQLYVRTISLIRYTCTYVCCCYKCTHMVDMHGIFQLSTPSLIMNIRTYVCVVWAVCSCFNCAACFYMYVYICMLYVLVFFLLLSVMMRHAWYV